MGPPATARMSEAQTSPANGTTIESVLQEQRVFEPPASLAAGAAIGSLEAYRQIAAQAQQDPDQFWGEAARRELHWFEPCISNRPIVCRCRRWIGGSFLRSSQG